MTRWMGVFEGVGCGFRFEEGHSVQITDAPTRGGGRVDIRLSTRYESVGGGDPYPVALRAVVVGDASSREDVMQRFWEAAQILLPVIGAAANASVPEMNLVAAIEISAAAENEVVHRLEEDSLFVRQMKELPSPEVVLEFVSSAMSTSDGDWVHRAMLQYSEGLGYWREGAQLMVVEHLFMAAEVISRVTITRQRRLTGLTRKDLAVSWGLGDPRELESAIRAEVIFRDAQLAKRVQNVSDGLEHGYATFPQLQADAAAVRDAAAQRVRESILGLIDLSPSAMAAFSDSTYSVPARSDRVAIAFGGTLLGSTECVTEDDVPMVEGDSGGSISFEKNDKGGYRLTAGTERKARIPEGLVLRIESIATSGPIESIGDASVE